MREDGVKYPSHEKAELGKLLDHCRVAVLVPNLHSYLLQFHFFKKKELCRRPVPLGTDVMGPLVKVFGPLATLGNSRFCG